MTMDIPDPSLVVLIGPSGAGKTTFARKHFRPTEILGSDAFRALVADDEAAPDAGPDAFQALRLVAARRLRRGRLTVIDATNVLPGARRPLVGLARGNRLPAVAIVFDLPERVRQERNRLHRALAPQVLDRQADAMRHTLGLLAQEGFAPVYVLDSEQAVAEAVVARHPAPAQDPAAERQDHAPRQLELLDG